MGKEMCNECLKKIMFNLTKDDLLILEYLYKAQALNPLLAIGKDKTLESISDITNYKYNISIARLEVCSLVVNSSQKNPRRYYITEDGVTVLSMFIKNFKEQQKQLKIMEEKKVKGEKSDEI